MRIIYVFFCCPVVFSDKWIYVQKGSTKEVSHYNFHKKDLFDWNSRINVCVFPCQHTASWILHTWWSPQPSRLFQRHSRLEKIQLCRKSERWRSHKSPYGLHKRLSLLTVFLCHSPVAFPANSQDSADLSEWSSPEKLFQYAGEDCAKR